MSAVPFSKISTPLNALFATIGLLVVATLTTHGLTGQERLVFELLLIKGTAVASDTFHVGDQVQDKEAARAAGIVAIGVTWGLADDRELRASAPDAMFNTVGELKTYFDI